MRSRSSLMMFAPNSSATAGASVHSLSSRCSSSGAKVWAVRCRRKTSSARFFATAIRPGGGVFWHALEFPNLQRTAEGVLDDVLRQRQVVNTEHARERGDHAPRLTPKEVIARLHHMFNFMTGRTSTAPSTSKIGQPLESSTASLKSSASISV